jgi:hypothetical protein
LPKAKIKIKPNKPKTFKKSLEDGKTDGHGSAK